MFFLITFLLATSTAFAVINTENLCGNSHPKSMVTSPLAKKSKLEWCFGGVCEENGKTFERQKCVAQMSDDDGNGYHENAFLVSHEEVHRDPDRYMATSYTSFNRLYPGDDCFEECRPEDKTFLGIDRGKKLGAEKEGCVRCMIKHPARDPDSYEVIGEGVRVFPGQMCHSLCKLPAGPYLEHRPYSSECLNCIGAMGVRPVIEHLVNNEGDCFEIAEGRYKGTSKVPERFCKGSEKTYGTYFKKSSRFTLSSLVFGVPQTCQEVDDKSGGGYYNRTVDMTFCDPESGDDSERGNKKDSTPTQSKKPSSGAVIKN